MNTREDLRARREQMRTRSQEETTSMMKLAGFDLIEKWELVNGYWPDAPEYDDVREPWWLFNTSLGLIRIGRRKRVIEIDWRATDYCGKVTTEVNVTSEEQLVHAWSTAKAVEYLTTLRMALAAHVRGPS